MCRYFLREPIEFGPTRFCILNRHQTQTNRFAAAVAGAGLSDWLSYYGLNDIDEWMIPFFGASVYDDPAVYQSMTIPRSIKSRIQSIS